MKAFIKDSVENVRSGQSMMYVNSSEESRVVSAVRRVGWMMADGIDMASLGENGLGEHDMAKIIEAFALATHPLGDLDRGFINAADFIKVIDFLEHRANVSDDDEILCDRLVRLAGDLKAVLDRFGYPTICWDMESGFDDDHSTSEDFKAALLRVGTPGDLPSKCLLVFKDCHLYLSTTETNIYRRALRNRYETNQLVSGKISRHIFFVQSYLKPHEEIRHCLARMDFPRLNDKELDQEITLVESLVNKKCGDELRSEIIRSLRGLDISNVQTILSKCIVRFKGFIESAEFTDPDTGETYTERLVSVIRSMRSRQLSTGQGMRIIDPDDPELTMAGDLAGYENVQALSDEVKFCRSVKAVKQNLRAPSGMGIAGPPGTGKTVCAKLMAQWLGVPLVIVQMGTVKEGIVGASEHNMNSVIETIKAIGECAVLFDEWDKQASGIVGSNGGGDGNTSSGMMSIILDFASDPRRQAFLIFTMNRLDGPIESLRTGRISVFLYTPLPDHEGRARIIRLKLKEQGAEEPAGLEKVADDAVTAGLSGAELTGMVDKALIMAVKRCDRKAPTVDELIEARKFVTPMTALKPEEIAAMEAFAGIAVPVGNYQSPKPNAKAKGRRINLDRN